MGNNNCKQCTSSVFKNEEDEETWFEWMESRSEYEGRNQKSITPRTQPMPVQPFAFQADVIDKWKSKRPKPLLYFFNDRSVHKERNLVNPGNDRTLDEFEPASRRDLENNNSAATNQDVVFKEDSAVTSQIFPDFPAGEVNVSLTYEKSTSRLKVHIIKARNLCCKVSEGKKQDRCGVSCSDLYIKTSLLSGQNLLQSFRTSKKRGSTDILFYENHAFDLTFLRLCELTLRLTAMHCCKHLINTEHVIGHVDTDDKSSETSFGTPWLEVTTFSGRNVNKWHTLWC